MSKYDDCDWTELPSDIKEAAGVLGYTKDAWDHDKEPAACKLEWAKLTDAQKAAAQKMGYDESSWDGNDTDSD
jgi:hypothetical protein